MPTVPPAPQLRPARAAARRPLGLPVGVLLLGLAALAAVGAASAGSPHPHPATGGFRPPEPVSGQVVDAYSGLPVPNVTVRAFDFTQVWQITHADAKGRFVVESVPGTVYLTVDPPDGYDGVQLHVDVADRPVGGLVVPLVPSGMLAPLRAPGALDLAPVLGAAAGAAFAVAAGTSALRQRRIASGRSGRLLSRFGQYVVVRSIAIPFQLLVVLVILYLFGTFLPAIALAHRTGCLFGSGASCVTCPTGGFACQLGLLQTELSVFGQGLGTFIASIATGQWGLANFGSFRLPAVDFFAWWLPYSLELAAVALLLSLAIGYPLGLAAGWNADGVLDRSLRGLSILLLLLPTFLVVLFLLTYAPWNSASGDNLYGLAPSQDWFVAHGGFRSWFGFAGQSSPTGFPIVDAALHGDWPVVVVIGTKLVIQALAIAIIYVSIFFRFARNAFAESARSEAMRAARARGVPEVTLAWRHSGRRVLPVLVLIFGMTLPAYLGTQALVEVLFNDSHGFGTILFSEMTQVSTTGFGIIHRGAIATGNLYQVTIFFLALVLLVGNLCADILARYLDHSLDATEGP